MELKLKFINHIPRFFRLLIVPYGIETPNSHKQTLLHIRLLIVPYGIETLLHGFTIMGFDTFNRTLWN